MDAPGSWTRTGDLLGRTTEPIYAIDVYPPMAYMSWMLVSVVETDSYLSKARKVMSESEMETVVSVISGSPMAGDVIQGTSGLRKLRIPLQGRGKRGGGRVVYWYYNEGYPAFYCGFLRRMRPMICRPVRKSNWLAPRKRSRGSSGA